MPWGAQVRLGHSERREVDDQKRPWVGGQLEGKVRCLRSRVVALGISPTDLAGSATIKQISPIQLQDGIGHGVWRLVGDKRPGCRFLDTEWMGGLPAHRQPARIRYAFMLMAMGRRWEFGRAASSQLLTRQPVIQGGADLVGNSHTREVDPPVPY